MFWSSAVKLIDFGEIQDTPSTVFPVLKKDLVASGVIRATPWVERVWVRLHTVVLVTAVPADQPSDVLDCVDTTTWQPGLSQQRYRQPSSSVAP
jgi:hypothetical protein